MAAGGDSGSPHLAHNVTCRGNAAPALSNRGTVLRHAIRGSGAGRLPTFRLVDYQGFIAVERAIARAGGAGRFWPCCRVEHRLFFYENRFRGKSSKLALLASVVGNGDVVLRSGSRELVTPRGAAHNEVEVIAGSRVERCFQRCASRRADRPWRQPRH